MNLFVDKMVAASLKLLSEMESASIPSNEHASTSGSNANSSSMRAKCDLAWDHVTEELKEGKSSCLFETFLLFECNELIYLVRSLSETYLLFGCNELIYLVRSLFETYLLFGCNELIYLVLHYLDVMNLFAICHLDVNVMTNELIYLILLKVYYVKDDCFVMLLC